LLADGERYYLALNRRADNDPNNRRVVYYSSYSPVRTQNISGAVFAFDRATAKRLWFEPTLFINQNLIVEQFADVPGLVTATQMQDESTNQGVYRVTVVDKRSGRIRYLKNLNQGGNFFGVVSDPRAGQFKFLRSDKTLILSDATAAVSDIKPQPPARP
jgi:hypothetical protein